MVRESDWLLRGSSAANQILLRHSGPILSSTCNQSLVKSVKNKKCAVKGDDHTTFLMNGY